MPVGAHPGLDALDAWRDPRPTRAARLLDGLDLARCRGAEIGPLHRPLVDRRDHAVFYVDHCETEALRRRWASDPSVDTAALHVDAVWGERSLKEALAAAGALHGGEGGLDYVVASHVVEHVPDLVTWLREVRDVLAPTGVLRLAVPDRRYTFDRLRRETLPAEVLSAYVRRRRVPDAGRVLDFAMHMSTVDPVRAWNDELGPEPPVRGFTDAQALLLAEDAERNGTYHDVHCWVFTPQSFVDLMARLVEMALIDLACQWITPTARHHIEFLASLRPEPDRARALRSWQRPDVV